MNFRFFDPQISLTLSLFQGKRSAPGVGLLSLILGAALSITAEENPQPDRVKIQLATSPALSPDGKQIAFGWAGNIWIARTRGGIARQLTAHPASENGPIFSPDGQQIAFTSNRTGQNQVWTMPVKGGIPTQVTFHSEGSRVVDWYADGHSLLIEGTRDFATRSAMRFYRINLEKRSPEALLFDAEGHSGALSPDGKSLLFCREDMDLYRKGYHGSRASQIWLAENLESDQPKFTKLIGRDKSARSPMWKPDGSGFYYLSDHGPGDRFDVWERDIKTRKETRLTDFTDDPAILPSIARDGSTIVFRKGFEFFRLAVDGPAAAKNPLRRIALSAAADTLPEFEVRRTLTKASNVSFSADGLEIAFIAGGDLWVMDTELREPVPITQTPAEEGEPVFSADGESIFFIRDGGTEADIWSVKRGDKKTYWWRNREFVETRLTKDGATKADLQAAPGGKAISWISGAGDLWTAENDGSEARRLLESWNRPQYDWAPDGQWLAWAVSDNDFNRDVWIASVDGKTPPYNLSRHPDSDGAPKRSPDGKMLTFTGRRRETETDIYYVHLSLADEEKDKRDRTLESALEKMDKARPKPAAPKTEPKTEPDPGAEPTQTPPSAEAKPEPPNTPPPADPKPAAPKPEKPETETPKTEKPSSSKVVIDFDHLYERIHHIANPNATESGLFWSHDSKRLAFSSEVKGTKGTFYVTFPDKLTPTGLSSKQGGLARWIAKDDTILWLVDGIPSTLSKGKSTSYPFTALQSYDRRDQWRTGFQKIWRTMGDVWYDENLNHLDWEAIRERYEDVAANAADSEAFDRTVAMMLGELNGSHLGYKSNASGSSYRPPQGWNEETAHLGLTFDLSFAGPGLKIATVIPQGPTDHADTRLAPGDVIRKIDGTAVDRETDLTTILNGVLSRDITLTVARKEKSDEIVMRPISYSVARELMKEAQVEANRAMVEKLSGGRIGYVFVPRMAWDEFIKFEEEIFARGMGKDGLIIDVRDNGGGFTADHLLTVLTPAEHAFTVPRGGGVGYPQDRRVYATWKKPITVLCNQNSFSNAEIFSHAVKELGRGKLVGVPTAGGVISTGSTSIMDLGTLRTPFRGWYRKSDGADMELNGAIPDAIIWPHPSDPAAGRDRQIQKGVSVLMGDIKAAAETPAAAPVPASTRE